MKNKANRVFVSGEIEPEEVLICYACNTRISRPTERNLMPDGRRMCDECVNPPHCLSCGGFLIGSEDDFEGCCCKACIDLYVQDTHFFEESEAEREEFYARFADAMEWHGEWERTTSSTRLEASSSVARTKIRSES